MSSSVVCAENASLLAQHVCSSVNHMAHIYVTSQTYAHMMQSDSRERLDLVPVLTFLPPTSATLCSWFQNNSELTKIDLSNQGALHYRQVEILIEFLRQTTTLQELNLSGCLRSSGKFHNVPQDVVDDARNDLKVQIGKNEALLRSTCDEKSKATFLKFPEEISLENRDECIDLICMITFDGFLQVLLSLIENTSILRLNLSQNDIGCMESSIERCHLLARYIDWNETLTYLNLSDNSLLNSHFAILSKGLTKNIKLSTIDISGNGIDRDSEFSLENEVNEEDAVFGPLLLGLEGMGEVVQKNKFLRDIILRRNELSVQDVALPIDETACCDQNLFKFIEPFRRYNRLRLLDLSSNFLGDTGIALLCHVLEKNKSLKHLYLGDNDMSFDGLTGVTSLLKKTELECLSLRNSKLDALDIGKPRSAKKMNTKVGVKAFERATHILQDFVDTLRRNLSLVTIDLAFCHLGSNAMKSICCALASRPIQMQHLDISGNNIGAVSSQEDLATFFSTELLDKCISLNLGWNFFEFADILLPLSNSCGSVKMLEVLVLSRAGFNNKVTLISHPPLKFKECIFPQTLTELDLSHNSDRQAIAALLMHLKVERQSLRLENLNVSYTSLNFDEIQTLCDSKWAQQQGKKIWMKGNLICDKGLAKLGSFLGVAKNLLVLDLGGAACSFDALISFFQNVRTNHLQILEIWSVHATVNSKLLKQIISFCEANTKLYYLELNIQQSGACWDNEDFCVLLQRMKEILRIKI